MKEPNILQELFRYLQDLSDPFRTFISNAIVAYIELLDACVFLSLLYIDIIWVAGAGNYKHACVLHRATNR